MKIKHNGKYAYPDYNRKNYINRRSKIDIICHKHGIYSKKVQKHLAGQECFKCRIQSLVENNLLVGGYSEELFENKPELKNIFAHVYYLEIDGGKFYKIGISKNFKNRIKGIKSKSKEYVDEIHCIKKFETTLYKAFLIEREILEKFRECRVYSKWSTELFDKNILEEIEHYFE
jgi:hypothetical protein